MAPTHLCPHPQTVLLWSPRGAPAQPAGHDPRQTLHPYPRPPCLRKLGDPGWQDGGARATQRCGSCRDWGPPWGGSPQEEWEGLLTHLLARAGRPGAAAGSRWEASPQPSPLPVRGHGGHHACGRHVHAHQLRVLHQLPLLRRHHPGPARAALEAASAPQAHQGEAQGGPAGPRATSSQDHPFTRLGIMGGNGSDGGVGSLCRVPRSAQGPGCPCVFSSWCNPLRGVLRIRPLHRQEMRLRHLLMDTQNSKGPHKTEDPKQRSSEFQLWLSGLRTRHNVCEDAGSISGLASCGVGHTCSSDLVWPWL